MKHSQQVSLRFPLDLLAEMKSAADREGLTVPVWIKNACLSILRKEIPGTIGRSEFEEAIANLAR